MKLGASTTNLSGIFCENCDFSGITFPHDTHFEYAILRNSRFVRANLNGAKFNNADLSSASFFGAILTNSNLSQDLDLRHPDLHQSGRAYQNYSFPFLECANLIGADLTGLPLGELQIKFSGSTYPYLNISVHRSLMQR